MLGTKPNTMDHTFATCFDVRSALPLFVGGDLEIEELRAVEEHLEACPSCQEHQQRARAARAVLTARRDDPSPDLWTGVQARLATEGVFASAGPKGPRALETTPTLRSVPLRPLRLLPVGVLSAAAAVICAFLLAGFLKPDSGAEAGQGPGTIAGTGGTVIGTMPVVGEGLPASSKGPALEADSAAPEGFLRPLSEGAEFMYQRGREMHTEQGIVIPSAEARGPR